MSYDPQHDIQFQAAQRQIPIIKQFRSLIHTCAQSTQPADLGDVKLLAESGVDDVLGGAAKGVTVGRPQHYDELVAEVLECAYPRAAAYIGNIPDGQRGT